MAPLCGEAPFSASSQVGNQDSQADEAGILLEHNLSAEDLN